MRPSSYFVSSAIQRFQSTHSLRSATVRTPFDLHLKSVSIHALLAECDSRRLIQGGGLQSFNPRTPCGVRPMRTNTKTAAIWFQSTHSLRSATPDGINRVSKRNVSIHALLAECDSHTISFMFYTVKFQSTHSLRSATKDQGRAKEIDEVSIHALLAECDDILMWSQDNPDGFNPRTPCGVRLVLIFNEL